MMAWVKRILVVLIVGFFLFYLIQQPEAAAGAVRTVFAAVGVAFQSIVRFFTSLAGG
jgi:small-conductance mechanosensitive channel